MFHPYVGVASMSDAIFMGLSDLKNRQMTRALEQSAT
jgi:hypothetical protein